MRATEQGVQALTYLLLGVPVLPALKIAFGEKSLLEFSQPFDGGPVLLGKLRHHEVVEVKEGSVPLHSLRENKEICDIPIEPLHLVGEFGCEHGAQIYHGIHDARFAL